MLAKGKAKVPLMLENRKYEIKTKIKVGKIVAAHPRSERTKMKVN